MSRVTSTTVMVAASALAIGLIAVTLATASYSPRAIDDIGHGAEVIDVPTPVVGNELFVSDGPGSACIERDQVIGVLYADQTDIGGQTVAILDGRDQAFADTWRDWVGLERVEVSGVVGHTYLDRGKQEWMVDVVEFDASGCAMSRTPVVGTNLGRDYRGLP